MPIRRSVKSACAILLATAILAAPSVAGAQSLFGSPAPASAPAPSASPSAPAHAPAKVRRPAKKALPTDASLVNVVNQRAATLVELSVTSTTAKDAQPQIVAHDLASGNKISAKLAKKGGCIYEVNGTFDDQSTVELSAADLCKDNNLNLVE